jgi:hypothetical protein
MNASPARAEDGQRANIERAKVEEIPAAVGRDLGDALLEAVLAWKRAGKPRHYKTTRTEGVIKT